MHLILHTLSRPPFSIPLKDPSFIPHFPISHPPICCLPNKALIAAAKTNTNMSEALLAVVSAAKVGYQDTRAARARKSANMVSAIMVSILPIVEIDWFQLFAEIP